MKRFAFIAMLVVFAMVLGTCDFLEPEALEEWTDVEYEIEGRVGQERVKSIKLYFRPDNVERSVLPGPNTYGVKVSPEQRRIIRALTADTAAASHDFFEAVFYCNANQIVRTTWEIGYPAGVSGSLLVRGTAAAATNLYTGLTTAGPASTVFVGRKTNKTLLGVGWLSHINDVPIGTGPNDTTGNILDSTYSVTYTVAPIKTWLGFTSAAGVAGVARAKGSFYGEDGTGAVTFTGPAGRNENFSPAQGLGNVVYPLYERAAYTGTPPAASTMTATYTIGGLTNLNNATGLNAVPSSNSVLSAILVYGSSDGTGALDVETGVVTNPKGGLQVIKRKPAYLFNGRTYEAASIYDSFTQLVGVNGTTPVVNNTHGTAFANEITLTFNIFNQSSGIFAITFQCPVYAITTLNARNPAATTPIDKDNRFVKWFIRPADGPNLYLLDSGTDEGGMVMIGDRTSFSNDWIEIKTTGIGFNNN